MRPQPIVDVVERHWRRAATAIAAPAAVLVLTAAIDALARRMARVPVGELGSGSLTLAAVRADLLLWTLAVGAVAGLAVLGRRGLGLAWRDVEQGRVLQGITALCVALLTWRSTTTGYDYLFGSWHAVDRLLLVGAAIAAIAWPAALLAFVVLARVVEAPLLVPFAFSPGQNMDHLLLMVLTVVAGTCVYAMATGDGRSPHVLTLVLAVVAAHFFVPGRGKLALDWLQVNDLGNMPRNGYAQGWLGAGDGGFARWLGDRFDEVGLLLRAATVALELGAPLAVLHRRLAIGWLVGFVVFHLAVAAALGFSFLEWVLVEVALLAVLAGVADRSWVAAAFRPGAVIVALVAVVAGGRLFDPPRLAWIDGPLVYAYEIDGTDTTGRRWALTAADFAPYDHVIAFAKLPIGPRPPLADGYGAIDDRRLDELEGVDSLERLAELEVELAGPGPSEAQRSEAVWLLERFMAGTGRSRALVDRLPAPPRHFWTDRAGRRYDRSAPLVRLEVTRVTTLRTPAGGELRRREPVLVIDHADGRRRVAFATGPGGSAGRPGSAG